MSDLVKRADDAADLLDAGSVVGISTVLRQCASEIEHLQECIEALEARVAAADKLVDAADDIMPEAVGFGQSTDMQSLQQAQMKLRTALADYQATKEGE